MNHLTYSAGNNGKYSICFLVPTIRKDEIHTSYLKNTTIDQNDVLVLDLFYDRTKKKTPIAQIKNYIVQELVSVLDNMGVKYVFVADSEYFKALTKSDKADANIGYVLPSAYGNQQVIYIPNYKAIFYDPIKIKAKIALAIAAYEKHVAGTYADPGKSIIKTAYYPKTLDEIEYWLVTLLEMNCPLTIDIEGFSLKHYDCGIGSISFAWSIGEGIAFAVDYQEIPGATEAPYGIQIDNKPVKRLLKAFFEKLTQRAIYHSIAFDVYVLIYELFMKDILDTPNLLKGLEVMLRNWHCTKLITYLATNSCAGNKLSLKEQAQEFAGNYAKADIKDIRKIPLPELLEYNLADTLSTWFTYHKHWNTVIADNQLTIYEGLFQPGTIDIVQMQLTGLPVNMKTVIRIKAEFLADQTKATDTMKNSRIVQAFVYKLNEEWVEMKNNTLKKKRVTLADAKEDFNPNSPDQLQKLLFEFLSLPVLSLTDSKQPSTDMDTLKALRNHTADVYVLEFLAALIDFKNVNKMLTSFIPALENARLGPDGWHYLFGNFNLGGTLSGRLSANDPNLTNLPASSKYAKQFKEAIQAPPGWLLVGLDFNSLEDVISALTTKDPNKLKVYTDGYNGHCLRAFGYFGDQMTGIVDTVASINSIESKYPELRQESKAPTFALTYQGTFKTLMTNCGFSMEKAKMVERKYHELYAVSDAWVKAKLDQASIDGYVTVAFGLRVRTPLLHQVIRGNRKTPYEAEAEARSAGNALGQSWCLLNTRASAEFMQGVRKSKFKYEIRPCAHIHDAQYLIIKDDLDTLSYTNKYLVQAVEWQAAPEIQHPTVKLGGKLSVFWPNWSKEVKIPNRASDQNITDIVAKVVS